MCNTDLLGKDHEFFLFLKYNIKKLLSIISPCVLKKEFRIPVLKCNFENIVFEFRICGQGRSYLMD